MKNITAHDLTFEPFISEAEIAAKVMALGSQIRQQYKGKRPLFVGVLNGAFVFAADLVRAASIECEVAFVRLASYEGTASSGQVSTVLGLDFEVKNRHIIVVEDIVDSGRTLHHFIAELQKLQPASVALAALLFKPEALQFPVNIDYLGFEIPDKFVVGYGLDYNGLCRNLPSVYQLSTI
ncbi:MAG: hypoxanthine phosphoribosyltransferase [Saprospiraceae bacterium]|nr:hypoxanthine phosphoribosyltransferase [Saprospiraceae bacterium]MCF8251090.1 hypoxanthine phosphoribosyltransferase [Saprospiraceae bacterium]MCF8280375.1 hypoxanthine phosphoribosyltransferase [Bacteroidales bacterium]MCF8312854.1 hypoxanthine phosphoribosyltransferase [Saprospiraceae bacterium]MCF8441349.1 hypoxanthine phosphoribosyltransferase [Saprospiraceae bacterium]